MTHITELDGYTFFINKDQHGFDLEHLSGRGMGELKKVADTLPNCIGFNTGGYLKFAIKKLTPYPNDPGKISGSYIKNDRIPKNISMPVLSKSSEDTKDIEMQTIKYFSLTKVKDLTQTCEHRNIEGIDYIFIPNVECVGYQYNKLEEQPVDILAQFANRDQTCMGFNSEGWLYFLIDSQFLERKDLGGGGLYIHKERYLEYLERKKILTPEPAEEEQIPRKLHFIWFAKGRAFNLVHMLGIKTAHHHNPDYEIFLYSDGEPPADNPFYAAIKDLITLEKIIPIQNLNGKHVQAFQHKADYLRLQKLYEKGGIYLDLDILTLKSFDEFLKYPMAMGFERTTKMNFCNAVIMTKPQNVFIKEWLNIYRVSWGESFIPWWLGHSTYIPFKLSHKYSNQIRVEPNTSFFPFLWYDHSMLQDTDTGKTFLNSYTMQFWETELEKTNLIPKDFNYFIYQKNGFTRMFGKYIKDIPAMKEILERSENYIFFSKKKCPRYDCKYAKDKSLLELLRIADSDPKVKAFSTNGTMNYTIDGLDKLQDEPYQKKEQGIFVKKDWDKTPTEKVYNIKIIGNWCDANKLRDEWNKMTQGHCNWNNLILNTYDPNVDYFVIINKQLHDYDYYDPKRTIVFQMEPMRINQEGDYGVKTWGEWAYPSREKFLMVNDHQYFYNNIEWHLGKTYTELSTDIINKNDSNILSAVISDKTLDIGHHKRISFLKYLESKNDLDFGIHIYGRCQKLGFKNYQGELPDGHKENGIFPYKYHLSVENNQEKNYFTEKLVDGILGECLCFYWGCPNVGDYIDPEAYIVLDLEDMDKNYQIVKNAIMNKEWEKRIDIIKVEKKKILNELQFFPRLEKIIRCHNSNLLNQYFDEIIVINNFVATTLLKQLGITYKELEKMPELEGLTGKVLIIQENAVLVESNFKKINLAIQEIVDKKIMWNTLSLTNQDKPISFDKQVGGLIYDTDTPLDDIKGCACFAIDNDCDNNKNISIFPWLIKNSYKNKESIKFDNFDTYCINLERRPDRKEEMNKLFKDAKFNNYQYYKAVDGKELTMTLDIYRQFANNDFNYRRGFIGCALSHIYLWQQLLKDENTDGYLILEDDIELGSNFTERLELVRNQLNSSVYWDVVYIGYHMHQVVLDGCRHEYRNDKNPELKLLDRSKYIGGTIGYFINRVGAKKILDYIKVHSVNHGIDYYIQKYQDDMELVQLETKPHLITSEWVSTLESGVDSDIQLDFKSVLNNKEEIKEEIKSEKSLDFTHKKEVNKFRFLMSYPRSGNHLVRFLIEYLTGLPTHGCIGNRYNEKFLCDWDYKDNINPLEHVNNNKEPIYYKSHGMFDFFSNEPYHMIFILRDPRECILRNCMNDDKIDMENIEKEIIHYLNLIEIYDTLDCEKLLIYYEDLLTKPLDILKEINDFVQDVSDDVMYKKLYENYKECTEIFAAQNNKTFGGVTSNFRTKYYFSQLSIKNQKVFMDSFNNISESYQDEKKYLDRYSLSI